MERAECARQDQNALVEFQQQAIERLDSNRGGILEAAVRLQLPFAHGELPPAGLLACTFSAAQANYQRYGEPISRNT